jgi:hypothetical protein
MNCSYVLKINVSQILLEYCNGSNGKNRIKMNNTNKNK